MTGLSPGFNAILWGLWVVELTVGCRHVVSVAHAHSWAQKVREICVPLGVPKGLVLAVIDLESKGNPLAVNMAINGTDKGFLPGELSVAHAVLGRTRKLLSHFSWSRHGRIRLPRAPGVSLRQLIIERSLDDALKQTPRVGIGLLPITYRYHQALMTPNPQRLFDPATHLAYGCRYLAQLLAQPGPLWQRLGRFHSASNLANQQDDARRVVKRMMTHIRQNGRGRP